MARYGIVIDLDRCVGCMTCVLACKEENLTRPGVWWNQIIQVEAPQAERIVYVRYACMHCENPPCVKACPNEAVYQRPDGIVLVDKGKCAGIGACIEACPYDVMVMTPDAEYFAGEGLEERPPLEGHRVHVPGKASTCTLCFHRVDAGLEPACVAGCPSRAMVFGDLDDPESAISLKTRDAEPLRASEGTKPKVSYLFPPELKGYIEKTVMDDPRMIKS
jgi:dimethyl sulfoxide reductase iron-sulfur subunit